MRTLPNFFIHQYLCCRDGLGFGPAGRWRSFKFACSMTWWEVKERRRSLNGSGVASSRRGDGSR